MSIYRDLKCPLALAGVAQWIEPWSADRKVTGLQSGHVPGLRARSLVGGGGVRGNQSMYETLMFLSVFLSLPSYLSKISK